MAAVKYRCHNPRKNGKQGHLNYTEYFKNEEGESAFETPSLDILKSQISNF